MCHSNGPPVNTKTDPRWARTPEVRKGRLVNPTVSVVQAGKHVSPPNSRCIDNQFFNLWVTS